MVEQTYINNNAKQAVIASQKQVMLIFKISSKIYKPTFYKKAISDFIHSRQWKDIVKEKVYNLESHYKWEFEELPQSRKPIGSTWVFRVRYNPDRSVAWFKTWLVVQKFLQVSKVDFTEKFVSIIKKKLLQIYLAICIFLGLIIHQINIVGVYLESLLDDNKFFIYIKLPLGINQIKKWLHCRLLRNLYGLRQLQTALEPKHYCIS